MDDNITAKGQLNGHDLEDIPVLNPGGWFGQTWLIELGGSYSPRFLIVEADKVSDATDELAGNEKFGHQVIVADEGLRDYPEDDRHYSGAGQVLDLDHLMIHGQEGIDQPFPCRYFGAGLPVEGIEPSSIDEYDQGDCES